METKNPYIDEFKKEYQKSACPTKTAKVFGAFPNPFITKNVFISWGNTGLEIEKYKDNLKYIDAGKTICRIGMFEVAGTNEEKLNEITLHNGVECLKSLIDIKKDNDIQAPNQREKTKNDIHFLLDYWKEAVKKAFKEDNKWVELTD